MALNIAVPLRQVPDLVEELEIAPDGARLAEETHRLITNEFDEHALEQALLLKEKHGGKVTVFALKGPGTPEALANAVAKGADEPVQLSVEKPGPLANHGLSSVLAHALKGAPFDLVLVGVQAVSDLDGPLGGLLAARLALPYVGVVAGVEVDPARKTVLVNKEFPGGLIASLEVRLPAVLGIQAAEQPPRYVPVSRVIQVKKALKAKELVVPGPEATEMLTVALAKPQPAARATMFEGDPDAVAGQIATLLVERGVV